MNYSNVTPFSVDLDYIVNDNELWNAFYTKFEMLAAPLKNMLSSNETAEILKDAVARPNGLSDAQLKNIARIVRDVILGDLFVGDIAPMIREKLAVDTRKANIILRSLVLNLFKPHLQELKQVQKKYFPERIAAKTRKNAVAAQPRLENMPTRESPNIPSLPKNSVPMQSPQVQVRKENVVNLRE